MIIGPMYASKSTTLLSHLHRATLAKRTTALFKPSLDDRYSVDEVVTHDDTRQGAIVVENAFDIPNHTAGVQVVGIDEAQFFDDDLVTVVNSLANLGKRVVISGLTTDFMGHPFATTAALTMIADEVVSLSAVCVRCGDDAKWTQMVVDGVPLIKGDRVAVGGYEMYEPRCRSCFVSMGYSALDRKGYDLTTKRHLAPKGSEAYVDSLRDLGADEETVKDAEEAADRLVAQKTKDSRPDRKIRNMEVNDG